VDLRGWRERDEKIRRKGKEGKKGDREREREGVGRRN